MSLDVSPFKKADSFFTARQCHCYPFQFIKRITCFFFTIWVIFWNLSRICIFFFSVQSIKSNCCIIFLKYFLIIFSWWVILSLLYLFVKGLIFIILYGSFLISSWFNATVKGYWKHLLSLLLIEFIAAFSLFIQSGKSIYDSPQFGFILWHL